MWVLVRWLVYRDNDPDYTAPPLAQLVVEMAHLIDRT